jgi:glutamate-1-semialdehyde 2,1-aminomutase
MLDIISKDGFYHDLSRKTKKLVDGLNEIAKNNNIPFHTVNVGGMFGLFFTEKPQINNFNDLSACNEERFKQFFHSMLRHGVYLAPSAFEAGFVSSTHDDVTLSKTLKAATIAFTDLN